MKLGGRVHPRVDVNGAAQSHFTVKVRGSQSLPGTMQEGSGAEKYALWLMHPASGSTTQRGDAHSATSFLDIASPASAASDAAFPGNWQYATIPLPRNWTEEKA